MKYLFPIGLVALILTTVYLGSNTQLRRCQRLYAPLKHADPYTTSQLEEVMAEEGFDSLDALITSRCKGWIERGQKF